MHYFVTKSRHYPGLPYQGRADRFRNRAQHRARKAVRRILATAGALLFALGSLIACALWLEYAACRDAGRTEAKVLTTVFAWDLSRSLNAADAAMKAIGNAIRTTGSDTAIARQWADIRQAAATIMGPETDVLIVGADGQLLLSSISANLAPANFALQAHFITHRNDPAAGLLVDPYDSRTYPDRLEVSRRLEYADGRFAGEVVVLLRPASILALHRDIDIGPHGAVAVVDADGIVRAGYDRTHLDGLLGLGTDLAGASYPHAIEPDQTTFYTGPLYRGAVHRLIAIRRLARYNLDVLVALDLDEVLASAHLRMLLIGLAGGAGAGLLMILTLLLIRGVWRRTSRRINLAGGRDHLRSAQRQMDADRAQLAEANQALLASQDSAEAAGRARSLFLAHMSHELRTPLHAIIGFSELIQAQAPTKPGSPPIAGYAADILASGRHLLELINSILDISKVESGTAVLAESAFPVGDLLRKSLEAVHGQAWARGVTIETRLPETRWRVRADRTRLSQVLINLLSNAVKFTPDQGRVILSVGESADGELVFSVIDAGIGMTEAEIDIALEPFGQVDSTFARLFDGTGLGLPLARKLIELHGGRLELNSVKGEGTTAKVILPAVRLVSRGMVRAGGE